MSFFDSIILGALEGFTEFLPISSTGHLILASELLKLSTTEFLKTFQISVQLGAILAVVVLFWRKFLDIRILKRLAVAFIPTGIVGFLLYPFIKEYLVGNAEVVVWALAIGGAALIAFERYHHEKDDANDDLATMPYRQALFVGVFQAIAVIPGVSRSAASIIGGLLAGMRRSAIVEFSFLLAVPTMVAATGYDILKSADAFQAGDTLLLATGFITAFIVALFSMRFLLAFVRRHSFTPFGYYRIALALVFAFFIL